MLIDARIIVLPVDDVPRAAEWYASVLRFAPRRMDLQQVCFDGGGYELRLVRHRRTAYRSAWIPVVYWRVHDLTAEMRRWSNAGARLQTSHAQVDTIGSTATFLDPFGNLVGLVQERNRGVQL